jgi:hypothetical protein
MPPTSSSPTSTWPSACSPALFPLDHLRLEGRLHFAQPPAGWQRRGLVLTRWSRRRTLAEGHLWRRVLAAPRRLHPTAGTTPRGTGAHLSPPRDPISMLFGLVQTNCTEQLFGECYVTSSSPAAPNTPGWAGLPIPPRTAQRGPAPQPDGLAVTGFPTIEVEHERRRAARGGR